MNIHTRRCISVVALWVALISVSGHADETSQVILTGTQATFSLASSLVRDTAIEVVNVPEDGRELSLLPDYIARRMDRLTPTFVGATAVISLTNALPGDPLYRFARDANIRIVDIDAAIPWSLTIPGVALTQSPESNVAWGGDTDRPDSAIAPYFWLSISNAIRMSDIIAHDLSQLFPEDAMAIASNLDDLKWSLLDLRAEYQGQLIDAGADTVFALTGDFVYLTNDMGLYVDGYFIKQDIRWTESDLESLTEHLRGRQIGVVIHKWMPSDEIQAAIAAAGAGLVVLQSGDSGIVENDGLAVDGLQRILEANLATILAGLAR